MPVRALITRAMFTSTAPSTGMSLCHRLSTACPVVAAAGGGMAGTVARVTKTLGGIGLETGGVSGDRTGAGAAVGRVEGREGGWSGGSVAARFMQSGCSGTRMSGPARGSWRQVGVESRLTHCPATSSSSSTSARQAGGCSPSRVLSGQV
jgi:hypothetical protein